MHSASYRTSLFFFFLHVRHELAIKKKTPKNQKKTKTKKPPTNQNPTNLHLEFCKGCRSSVLTQSYESRRSLPARAGALHITSNIYIYLSLYIYLFPLPSFLPRQSCWVQPRAWLGQAGFPQLEKHHLFRRICLFIFFFLKFLSLYKKKRNQILLVARRSLGPLDSHPSHTPEHCRL